MAQSKKDAAIAYLQKNPTATSAEIEKALGCSAGPVNEAKKELGLVKRRGSKKKSAGNAKAQPKTRATSNGIGILDSKAKTAALKELVEAAGSDEALLEMLGLIEDAGGIEEVKHCVETFASLYEVFGE